MASYDPFKQNVTFHHADKTPFEVPIQQLDDFVLYNTKVTINYGCQLGASIILIILVALLTSPEKRRSLVFFLNSAALALNAARLLCMAIYFTSAWSEVYAYFANDYSRVPVSAYANSILGLVFSLLLVICIEASLVVQTQVICSTLPDLYRRLLLAVSLVFALVPIGFRFAFTIENSKSIVGAISFSPFVWLQRASDIVLTLSVCYFSVIFMAKLGFAIRSRRQMGLTRFGAMQVIFVMSCQTMVIPAFFSILQNFFPNSEMNQNVLTLVAISLPLSSLWAAAAARHSFETVGSAPHHRLWSSTRSNTTLESKLSHPSQPSLTTCTNSTAATATSDQLDKLYPELEAGNGIRVDRQFSVSSTKC